MNRREFIQGSVLAAAGCLTGCRSPATGGGSYSVALTGDLHYDRLPIDLFHSAFRAAHGEDGMFARYRAELEVFASMWGEGGRSAGLVAASGRCRRPDTVFALQLGDLVEGNCESSEAHAKVLGEAFRLVKGAYGADLPFVAVAGNHDVCRGRDRLGEYDAYARISSAWNSKELGIGVTGLSFAFRQGPDVWVVADFNRPDADLIERLLEENRAERYTFFCTHGAVLTDGARRVRRWFYLGGPQYDATGRHLSHWPAEEWERYGAARRKVRRLLAERQAIALSGHSHRLELRDWFGDGGRITEFVMNSVTKALNGADFPGVPLVFGSRPEDFGRCRRLPNEQQSAAVEALYAEYEPGMRRYFTANAAGHARLRISDEAVLAEYFPLDATVPERTFELRS